MPSSPGLANTPRGLGEPADDSGSRPGSRRSHPKPAHRLGIAGRPQRRARSGDRQRSRSGPTQRAARVSAVMLVNPLAQLRQNGIGSSRSSTRTPGRSWPRSWIGLVEEMIAPTPPRANVTYKFIRTSVPDPSKLSKRPATLERRTRFLIVRFLGAAAQEHGRAHRWNDTAPSAHGRLPSC